MQDHGNTSAASVPLALSVAVADGRVKRGDVVLLEAMGGGFTWGRCCYAGSADRGRCATAQAREAPADPSFTVPRPR